MPEELKIITPDSAPERHAPEYVPPVTPETGRAAQAPEPQTSVGLDHTPEITPDGIPLYKEPVMQAAPAPSPEVHAVAASDSAASKILDGRMDIEEGKNYQPGELLNDILNSIDQK